MRIISKFKDYYDSVQMYGQDQNVLYMRTSESLVTHNTSDFHTQFAGIRDNKEYTWRNLPTIDGLFHYSFVVFVGDTYIKGMKLEKHYTVDDVVKTVVSFAFSVEDVDNFIVNEKCTEKEINRYLGLEKEKKYRFWHAHNPTFCQKDVKNFFDTKMQKNLCIDLRCPVVFYGPVKNLFSIGDEKDNTVKNPCLNTLELYKALPHGLAFQKIESFISGVLPGRYPEMIQVSEKTRLAKRGFDKWSFRKMPSKK